MKINTPILVNHLKQQQTKNAGFLDKIKITYRPYVCPFDDLLNEIPEASSVYDVGCGSGMLLSLIAEFRNPEKLGGCEISAELIKNAHQVLGDFKNKSLHVFDGTNIPKEISNYDIITIIDVLHHIPKANQLSFLEQMVQLMKPHSTLIFKDIRKESVLVYWNKIHDLLLADEVGNEVNSAEIKDYFVKTLKMSLIKQNKKRMLLYPHFTLILKKGNV